MAQTVRDKLVKLVRSNSRLRVESVRDEQLLNFELGFDSHALLNLLLDVEDAFGLEVPPEKVAELAGQPFGTLLDLVQQHLREHPAAE